MKFEPQPCTARRIPAERLLVVEYLEALPGAGGRGNVDRGETDAGHDLHDEEDERSAAENVPPARRVARDAVTGDLGERLAETQALVEPVGERA